MQMADSKLLFTDATIALNKICILPYTDDELEAIGRLGFDMSKNPDFADKYKCALLEKCAQIYKKERIAFSELNLQLYRIALQQPDLEQIPEQIIMPEDKKTISNIKDRILKLTKDIKNTQSSTE